MLFRRGKSTWHNVDERCAERTNLRSQILLYVLGFQYRMKYLFSVCVYYAFLLERNRK